MATFHLTGAFAEEMVAKGRRTIALPDGVSFETGAATLHNYVTAANALRVRGHLQDGETLVVHGATGGVGLAAVELGNLWGARVIACVGADEKAALAREYGAEAVINYRRESTRERVLELTEGRGADVVFDPVGGDAFDQSMRCVAWDGRILVVGFASGEIPKLPLNRPLLKSASVVGVNTGEWPDQDPAAFQALAADVLAWADAGEISRRSGKSCPSRNSGSPWRRSSRAPRKAAASCACADDGRGLPRSGTPAPILSRLSTTLRTIEDDNMTDEFATDCG